jgi:predicted RNA-binding protein with PIN domain
VPYLIDGHNLIGQTRGLSLADPDDEQKLVVLLRAYLVRTGKKGTVIFDNGQPGGSGGWANNVLKVVFAPAAGSADASILSRLEKNRDGRGLVLVSDDQRLVAAARRAGASVRASGEFARDMLSGPARAYKKEEGLSAAEVAAWEKEFKQRK